MSTAVWMVLQSHMSNQKHSKGLKVRTCEGIQQYGRPSMAAKDHTAGDRFKSTRHADIDERTLVRRYMRPGISF